MQSNPLPYNDKDVDTVDLEADDVVDISDISYPTILVQRTGKEVEMTSVSTRKKPHAIVNTIAQLELAIGQALAVVNYQMDPSRMAIRSYDDGNQSDYHCVLHKDGKVEMGCQTHTPADVDRIIAAAKSWHEGRTFTLFKTAAQYEVVSLGTKLMAIDGNRITTTTILALEKVRNKFLASKARKITPPKPVRLFSKSK